MMMRPKRSLDRLLALNASGDLMGSFTRTPGARPYRPSDVGDAERIEGYAGNIKCQRHNNCWAKLSAERFRLVAPAARCSASHTGSVAHTRSSGIPPTK